MVSEMREITDPTLIEELNATKSVAPTINEVTDPDLIAELEGKTKKKPAQESWISPEVASHPATMAAYGAAAPFIGLTQFMAETLPGQKYLPPQLHGLKAIFSAADMATGEDKAIAKAIRSKLQEYEQAKVEGGVTGFNPWEMAGGAVPAILTPGLRAAGFLPRVGAGMAEGAAWGASMPTTSEDYSKSKVTQALMGSAFGGGGGVIGDAGVGIGKWIASKFKPKDIAETYVRKQFGKEGDKYREAFSEYEPRLEGYKPTVSDALGQQQRKFQAAGKADLYSKEAIQLSKDLQKAGTKLDDAEIEAEIVMRKAVTGEKLTKSQEKALKKQRKKQADINYGKATGTIPFESNLDQVGIAILRAEAKKQQARNLQDIAMGDIGRFKTLEAQQASRATRTPPEVDPMLTNLTGKAAPTSRQMGDIYGQPRTPARYTPQRSVEEAAKQAAEDTSGIAKKRLAEQNLHQEIQDIFIKHAKGTDTTSLFDFMSRPSFKKAIKSVKESTEEAPGRYGKWPKPGEEFTVAQLGRIKREIAETVRREADEGTINATKQSEIMDSLESFNEFLKKKSSAYRFADEEFAKASVPIKRGKVSRGLEKKLFPEGRITQGPAYIKAIDDEKFLRKLTKDRAESIEDIFSTESAAKKRAVKELLLDKWESKRVKGKSNIRNINGNILLELPHILSRPVVITNAILKRLFDKDITPEIHEHLEMIMRNQDEFIKAIDGPVNSKETRRAVDFVRRMGAMAAAQSVGE